MKPKIQTNKRSASEGPRIGSGEMSAFRAYLKSRLIKSCDHTDPFIDGIQVRHDGHWMAVIWNKNLKRYTADHRLAGIVASFEVERIKSAAEESKGGA